MSDAAVITVRLLVAVGVIVVVPLALRLVDGIPERLVRWWPAAGAVGAASMWLPRGTAATVAAASYAGAALLLVRSAVARARELFRAPSEDRAFGAALDLAVVTALVAPAVAAIALVAERSGRRLFGFDLDILTLTVPHLHYAGCVAALVAGLVSRRIGRDPALRRAGIGAALTVPVGTVMVLVGYFLGDWAELAGAVVLTCGMWLTGWLIWARIRPGARAPVSALLAVSAAVLVGTMLLALSWAVGEATDWPHPSLGWMVGTHGVANALGFALCAVLAWRVLREEPL
jgi:YndJ-like protein